MSSAFNHNHTAGHERSHPNDVHESQHHHDHHDCQRYLGSLSDYVDGTLGDDLCRELEAHMAACENCRVVVNTLSKTITLYRRLPEPEMPHEVRDRLYKVLNLDNFQSEQDGAE